MGRKASDRLAPRGLVEGLIDRGLGGLYFLIIFYFKNIYNYENKILIGILTFQNKKNTQDIDKNQMFNNNVLKNK